MRPPPTSANLVASPSDYNQTPPRLPHSPAFNVSAAAAAAKHASSDHGLYPPSNNDVSAPIDPANFRAVDIPNSRSISYPDPLAAMSAPTTGNAAAVAAAAAAAAASPAFIPAAFAASPSTVGTASNHDAFLAGRSSAGSRSRRISPCDDSFVIAAETGARAQCAVDNASGEGVFETYDLGIAIVQSSKLYANQRRSNRLLPGGSDSTTAACYMIGGTPDSVLSPLVAKVSPCDPREERCKAVERVLKDKTRGAICALNGENPREARADNLAAVRICEVVADILVAFRARKLLESRKQLIETVSQQEARIKELQAQLEDYKRESERWRKGGGVVDEVGGCSRDGGVVDDGRTGEEVGDAREGVEDDKV